MPVIRTWIFPYLLISGTRLRRTSTLTSAWIHWNSVTPVEHGELIWLVCCAPLPSLAGLPYGSELDLRAPSRSSESSLLVALENGGPGHLSLPVPLSRMVWAGPAQEGCGAESLRGLVSCVERHRILDPSPSYSSWLAQGWESRPSFLQLLKQWQTSFGHGLEQPASLAVLARCLEKEVVQPPENLALRR